MKVWLICLFLALKTGVLMAQPVDLLQQLYGKKNPVDSSEEKAETSSPVEKDSLALPVAKEVLRLSLRDRVELGRERIFLSDLVSCKGAKANCDEILSVDVGPAPKPMRQERIPRAKLEDLLTQEFPNLTQEWEGGDGSLVIALAYPIDEEKVFKVISQEFEDAPAGLRVIVQGVRVPSLGMLRHNNYVIRVKDFGDQVNKVFQNPRTRFAQFKMVAVDQDPSSQSEIEFLAQVSMRIEIEALVAKDYLERGERIQGNQIELQWIPYQDQLFSEPDQVVGKIVKSRIQANNVIRTWDLTREPEIMRGDRVEAVVSSNGLKINGVAQALEQGFVGQKIRIRMESTKKTIIGKVIAKSKVEISSL